MQQYLNYLGHKVKEQITGLEGVAVSISFDLNGCVQAFIERGYDKDGKRLEGQWLDTKRLRVVSKKPLVKQPTFEHIPGGRELPPK
jgi:hypothetical protein